MYSNLVKFNLANDWLWTQLSKLRIWLLFKNMNVPLSTSFFSCFSEPSHKNWDLFCGASGRLTRSPFDSWPQTKRNKQRMFWGQQKGQQGTISQPPPGGGGGGEGQGFRKWAYQVLTQGRRSKFVSGQANDTRQPSFRHRRVTGGKLACPWTRQKPFADKRAVPTLHHKK